MWSIAESVGVSRIVGDIADLESGSLDAVLDFAGTGETTRLAMSAVRVQGRIVQVRLASLDAHLSMTELVTLQVTLIGSSGGSTDDIAQIYELMSSGDLAPLLPTIGFDEIPDGLARVEHGEVTGRLVAVYGD